MTKRKMGFRGKMRKEIEKRKRGNSFGYLMIPRGVDVFSPENECKITLDIMPYLVTDKNHPNKDLGAEEGIYYYRRPFKIHRDIGVNRESVLCLTSVGKRCPICEHRTKLRKEEGSEDEIKALRPSNRNLYAVVIRKVDRKISDNDSIQLFEFSDYLLQETMESQLEDDERWDTFPDPEEGSSIKIVFAEDSIGTNKYPKPTRFDFVEREEQYDESILDDVPKLDECLNVLSYEELKNKFYEMGDDEEEEVDEEEVDEEEVEDEVDDEEEVEEEKPKRRTRSRKSKEPECPFGHRFGKDNDRYDDCDDCDVWNDCIEKKKQMRK